VVAEIENAGGKAIAVQGDVSKAPMYGASLRKRKGFRNMDLLVNNAAIYEFAPLGEITEEHFHRQFNTNVMGLLLVTQEAVKAFARGWHIINISSTASQMTPPTSAVYSATKSAVDAVTRVLAKELGRVRFASTPSILDQSKRKGCTLRVHGSDFLKQITAQTPLAESRNRKISPHRRIPGIAGLGMVDGRNVDGVWRLR